MKTCEKNNNNQSNMNIKYEEEKNDRKKIKH